jgi:mycofactocin precursor
MTEAGMDEQAVGTVAGQPEVAAERGAEGAGDAGDAGERLVDEELLVEEVSIDGMCGVY